jgi:predicted GIY-YIG superfamily endonuclease
VYGQDDDDFRGGGYYALQVYSELYPYLCDPCLRWTIRTEKGEQPPWYDGLQDRMPQMMAHAKLERNTYHVYILKMVDGTFYVGQTLNLDIRMREHRDGLQSQTKGKDPKLVYFERFQGDRDKVSERERELTRLSQSPSGCRRLREMIERFRGPLRLLDLEA